MRNFMLRSAGVLSALILGLGASACSRGEEELLVADANGKMVKVAKADTAADQRAAAAEARAREAEARIQCERERQEASNRGAVVGGVTGAVIGSQVAGDGAKSEGGVLGGIAGVLAGRQIAKKDHRC
jgi:uncharacterized protein YcfJ